MKNDKIPLSILNYQSKIKQLLDNHKQTNDFQIEILIGEKDDSVFLDLNVIGNLLIVGWSLSEKEQIIDSCIQSMMVQYTPTEVQFILCDDQAHLSQYDGNNPYLLTEVIYEPIKMLSALKWTIAEIDNRYKLFRKHECSTLKQYNNVSTEKKAHIVFVIQTFDTLTRFASNDTEFLLNDIILRGVNAGVHMILVTNDINKKYISSSILSNLPNRIICQLTTKDCARRAGVPEAVTLNTDGFYLKIQNEKVQKIKKIASNDEDIKNIREYFKSLPPIQEYGEVVQVKSVLTGELDPYFNQAVTIISEFDKASASLLQRRLKIGYARAVRILDELEAKGFVSPAEGSIPREVLKRKLEN